jgi:hypothetical protein
VPGSSDEELDSIINEMATLNATYSKERKEHPYVDNNLNLEIDFFEIERTILAAFMKVTFMIKYKMILMMT